MLVRKYKPDYLLLHLMGMDYMGEHYGADSSKYRDRAISQDSSLAPSITEWLEKSYTILVTSDHGISNDCLHGGTTPDVRLVPLFLVQPNMSGKGDTSQMISQLQIAPTICKLLGLQIPETMKYSPVV
jgi:predicted AlkP superfamily pyrophosphatase or phosphodiesterase